MSDEYIRKLRYISIVTAKGDHELKLQFILRPS